MYVNSLLLQNFRSHQKREFEFDPKTNLIYGQNGSGKTNLLEALYFLSAGNSFRASAIRQMCQWGSEFTSVRAKITNSKQEVTDLEIQLITQKELTSARIARKFYINKVEKARKNYLTSLLVVIFHPEDIRLVTGSPGRRRDYLDEIYSQIDWHYTQAVSQYKKALKHRNELLDQVRKKINQKSELFYWDQSLAKNDEIIHKYRKKFIDSVNRFFASHPNPEIKTINLNYFPSYLTQNMLDKNYEKDLACGYTSCGNHRDDFSFDNDIFPGTDKNLASWGSRGQQRLAVLAIKLAQIAFYEEAHQEKPILLLDDIFSELDVEHRDLVGKICQNYQTFFTYTFENINSILPSAKTIKM